MQHCKVRQEVQKISIPMESSIEEIPVFLKRKLLQNWISSFAEEQEKVIISERA